eukprot:CAMPEP_0204004982 /NCGR_PEP_ID=MMETSP0360-20130528/18754_1 /ASSEMBLY_ACC=CAM_ASM_000342 /TAXON_ID=268821 /ORGANISM="Scrippsiella Hangoei, Strain SHTV-5" /LENGTH=107 /DNA_ID=CAMNT_0050946915 /DNA_START=27 /DNA_END=348 /DNA_ORIENTATION=+
MCSPPSPHACVETDHTVAVLAQGLRALTLLIPLLILRFSVQLWLSDCALCVAAVSQRQLTLSTAVEENLDRQTVESSVTNSKWRVGIRVAQAGAELEVQCFHGSGAR